MTHDIDPRLNPDPRFRDVRDPPSPPRRDSGLSRFLGGSPIAVFFQLVLLSILMGVVLAVIGLDPWNIIDSVRMLFDWVWHVGFDAVRGLWRYFLLGAVIVVPIWFIARLFNAPRGR